MAGFGNVRIPVRWDEHTARTPPYAIDAIFMARVEQVCNVCSGQRGYQLLFTMGPCHHPAKRDFFGGGLRMA